MFKLLTFLFNYRYKPKGNNDSQPIMPGEDLTSDYMNILGMILSMAGLLMKVKQFTILFWLEIFISNFYIYYSLNGRPGVLCSVRA